MTMKSSSNFKALITDIEAYTQTQKAKQVLPITTFSETNSDDLLLFDASMLGDISIFGGLEIDQWSGRAPKVTITELPNVTVNDNPTSVISITSVNKPFLYDSIIAEVTSGGRLIHMALHPILIKDDNNGLKRRVRSDKNGSGIEISHIQIHLPKLIKSDVADLKKRINHVLKHVTHAVRDWKPMLAKLNEAIAEIENIPGKKDAKGRKESVEFLNWLLEQNFTFLGMREYTYSNRSKTSQLKWDGKNGLGILTDLDLAVLRVGREPVISTPEIIEFLNGKENIIVTKANVKSVVHRRTYMDYIGVKRYNTKGEVCGELRIIGLFTSSAYKDSVTSIPLLRAKIEKVVDKFGFDSESHSGKSLLNTLESYPRDELFQIDPNLLFNFCVQINDMDDRPRVRVLPRIDQFDRFVSILVFVPRGQYNSVSREKIGFYLQALYGDRVSAYYPSFPSEGVARVHFIIGQSGGNTPDIDQKLLEQDVLKIVTRWEDQFIELAGKNADRISVNQSYMEHFSASETFDDLENLQACAQGEQIRITFLQRDGAGDQLAMKIFHSRNALSLSKRVPLLENMGFGVVSEQTHQIDVRDKDGQLQPVIVHDMELNLPADIEFDLKNDHKRLQDAFLSIWSGDIDNDLFNRLVSYSGLSIRETKVLRTYARYLRQAGITYSQRYMADSLVRYPKITQNLFDLFHNRFDPSISKTTRDETQTKILNKIKSALEAVPSLDDDRIINRFANAIMGTLRSNYFQIMADGEPNSILALKLNPKELDGLPEPVPYREIFVYGAEVEGVHLRFGPVARGGLRWSDRAEDYRTEVLGLVKAQQVKNAVIVPVGSKGGFYPKRLPSDGGRDAFIHAGREAYKLFISTMLSITDNLDGDTVVPPKNTIRHDDDDPYFVVAADKGTATFSDTANAISQAHNFWLDDAFASGGSAGYDHKKMGITAKGGWEAVKRHFREMNIDIQTEPFTVAGIGDMSGDVFGNGMLLSEKIQLVAAFDHRDIFLDPNPDCASSFEERKRIFALDRSSWGSYNQELLSKGGMIISRQEKSVNLTREVATLLQIDAKGVSPHQILTAILKAPTDLLWFGGIGTYIRDEAESDADAGDRANDPIRITAKEVGAKVIGEGANLGITQRARISYAANGGRCNSDAIDNSAGVNSSDVEVNIKIALSNASRENRLNLPKRNKLLSSMTSDVSRLVLRNNYLQTLAISLIEQQGVSAGGQLARLMTTLEADGLLNRKVETLPDDASLQERLKNGQTLTRPEIGVLLSYTKIVLFDDVIPSDLPDEEYFGDTLMGYFPKKMWTAHNIDIQTHRLKREIISTIIVNDAINRGGPALIVQMQDKTGAKSCDIVKAYILARDGLQFNEIFDAIDKLDNKLDGAAQNKLYRRVCVALIKTTGWALKTNAISGPLSTTVPKLQSACSELSPKIDQYLPDFIQNNMLNMQQNLEDKGVSKKLAKQIAQLETEILIPEINQIATLTQNSLEKSAQAFFAITKLLKIGRVLGAADNALASDHYDVLALSRNLDEISQARRVMAMSALVSHPDESAPVYIWGEENSVRILQVQNQIGDLIDTGDVSVAKLTIAAGLITDLSRG